MLITRYTVVTAPARGILHHTNPFLLKEHVGPADLAPSWVESFLRRNGYVKRKATKSVRKLPTNSVELKLVFLEKISEAL